MSASPVWSCQDMPDDMIAKLTVSDVSDILSDATQALLNAMRILASLDHPALDACVEAYLAARRVEDTLWKEE